MVTIYKYQFDIADSVKIKMPLNAEILSVQVQNGIPTLWARVDTDNSIAIHTLLIFGTGHEIPIPFTEAIHIGTIQLNGFVWHIFK